MKVDGDMALEIGSHEALVREAYKDSGGVWTWSVGLTSATGHNVERYIGNPQPLRHCMAVYLWALDNYAFHVREVFKGFPLTKEQFTAALSFCWNLGGGTLRNARWPKLVMEGKLGAAEKNWKSYRKAGGVVNEGLEKRRQRECDLFFRGIWSNDGQITEFTKLTSSDTPDWSSAQKINIRHVLEDLQKNPAEKPKLDNTPRPNDGPDQPTITPDGSEDDGGDRELLITVAVPLIIAIVVVILVVIGVLG